MIWRIKTRAHAFQIPRVTIEKLLFPAKAKLTNPSIMPKMKLILTSEGLDAQFRLIRANEEKEEGEIDDDDEEEEEFEENEHEKDQNSKEVEGDGENKDKLEQTNGKPVSKQPRISLFEMQSFLIALLLPGPRLSTPPSWCKVIRCMKATNVGIYLLDNVDLDWIEDKGSKFDHAFRFETSPNWIERLTSVPLSNRLQSLNLPREFGCGDNPTFETNLNAPPKVPRTSLLLSPIQMIVENYPMPPDEGIKILRTRIPQVTDDSPMFGIDCEMCLTSKSELTRISIVDEELRIVYNELVKPDEPITNYQTRYSGITQQMLENVSTTLEDVHYFMRKHLPRDAIFCGHSLNMDLVALQIFHPFVIDTSVIFSRSGRRSYKPSLKSLAYELLGKEIQTSTQLGHDSVEDAITAIELVKLKLINGLEFGDTVAFEETQGIKFDYKTGITHLPMDKFITRHDANLSYRRADTTAGARSIYIHDQQEPLEQSVKESILYLLQKEGAVCVIMTNLGECYIKL